MILCNSQVELLVSKKGHIVFLEYEERNAKNKNVFEPKPLFSRHRYRSNVCNTVLCPISSFKDHKACPLNCSST